MKRLTFLAAGLIVAAVAASYLLGALRPEPSASSPRAAAAVAVDVVELRVETVPLHEELPGRVVASEIAEIRPQVTGIITERLFVEGSTVSEGQQLYQIDAAPYEAVLRSAQADLEKARANVLSTEAKKNRYEELVKIDAVSRQAYDDTTAELAQAKAEVAIAQAAVATAKINLGYTKVYAPISGKIGKSAVTKGALVTANQMQQLATITRLDPIYADLVQPTADLLRMRRLLNNPGEVPVELFLEGRDTAYEQEGKLQFAEVTVDETTGSVQLRALFPNPDGLLLPGMFVRTRLRIGTVEGFLVPQRAATRSKDGTLGVWVVGSDDRVALRPVTAVQAVRDAWLVTDGMAAGERLVVKGIQKLKDGAPVTPTAAPAASSDQRAARHG